MSSIHHKPIGVYSALPTPLHTSGEIDLPSLTELMRWQLEPSLGARGVSGFVLYGTTGESPTLSAVECEEITRSAREAFPEVELIAGVGSNCTASSVERARAAQLWGADGGLVVTPYYNKPSSEGLYRHFSTIAEATPDWPLTLYVVPGRAVVHLELNVVDKLLGAYPNIVAVKDASADLSYCAELVSCCDTRAHVLSGDDPTALAAWATGARGSISVSSNLVPHEFVEIWSHFEAGHHAEARARFLRLHPLIMTLFIESNPAPLKAALAEWGARDLTPNCSARVRAPLSELTVQNHATLCAALERWRSDPERLA